MVNLASGMHEHQQKTKTTMMPKPPPKVKKAASIGDYSLIGQRPQSRLSRQSNSTLKMLTV